MRLLLASGVAATLAFPGCSQPPLEPLEWTLAELPRPEQSRLRLHVLTGNCVTYVRTKVDAQPDAVHVTALGRVDRDRECTAILIGVPVTVQLPEPIGSRTVVGGDVEPR